MNSFAKNILLKFSCAYKLVIASELLLAISIAVIVVGFGTFLAHENNKVVPVSNQVYVHYEGEPENKFSFLSDWDGPDYISIAQHGYVTKDETNFFPMYPLIIRVFIFVIRSPLDSALAVSWLSLIGAIYFYLKIVKHLFKIKDNREALRAVLLFVLFPTSVFMIATYTESLFAFLALAAVYYAFRKRYIAAGLMTLPLTATHTNGIFVLLLVAMILYQQKVKLRSIVTGVAVGVMGLISYMIYLGIAFHHPLAFISAQQQHGWLQNNYGDLHSQFNYINITLIVLMLTAIVYWWKTYKGFSLYVAFYLFVPLIGGQVGGFNRYALMAFPVQFMLFKKFRDNILAYTVVIVLTTIICMHFLFQYAGGYVGG
jgi:Gpi18-like mannosyltransferase